jgi:hypothetical protein
VVCQVDPLTERSLAANVGQGFVDELVRVWPWLYPDKAVIPTNMNAAVRFMIERGLSRVERPDQ